MSITQTILRRISAELLKHQDEINNDGDLHLLRIDIRLKQKKGSSQLVIREASVLRDSRSVDDPL